MFQNFFLHLLVYGGRENGCEFYIFHNVFAEKPSKQIKKFVPKLKSNFMLFEVKNFREFLVLNVLIKNWS